MYIKFDELDYFYEIFIWAIIFNQIACDYNNKDEDNSWSKAVYNATRLFYCQFFRKKYFILFEKRKSLISLTITQGWLCTKINMRFWQNNVANVYYILMQHFKNYLPCLNMF